MTDLIPLVAVISLIGNAVLMIGYARLYSRHADTDHENLHLLRHIKAIAADLRKLHDQQRNSVRRDPKTGRYIKNRSN